MGQGDSPLSWLGSLLLLRVADGISLCLADLHWGAVLLEGVCPRNAAQVRLTVACLSRSILTSAFNSTSNLLMKGYDV